MRPKGQSLRTVGTPAQSEDSYKHSPSTATYYCTNKESTDCFVAALLAMTEQSRAACARHVVDGYVDTGAIRKFSTAIYYCTNKESTDCFVATLLAMTEQSSTACTRHVVDGYEDTGAI